MHKRDISLFLICIFCDLNKSKILKTIKSFPSSLLSFEPKIRSIILFSLLPLLSSVFKRSLLFPSFSSFLFSSFFSLSKFTSNISSSFLIVPEFSGFLLSSSFLEFISKLISCSFLILLLLSFFVSILSLFLFFIVITFPYAFVLLLLKIFSSFLLLIFSSNISTKENLLLLNFIFIAWLFPYTKYLNSPLSSFI